MINVLMCFINCFHKFVANFVASVFSGYLAVILSIKMSSPESRINNLLGRLRNENSSEIQPIPGTMSNTGSNTTRTSRPNLPCKRNKNVF